MNRLAHYKNHEILFCNLLEKGWNMDKHILNGSIYDRPDHKFNNILRFLKKGSVIYDIGSYIGTYSIPMALEGMQVIAFEGFPDNYDRNLLNVKPYNNISVHPVAVSDVNEVVYTKFNDCTDLDPEEREIKYIRLDDYMREKSLEKPDLIKLDIEGMETVALFGMSDLLENTRPIWQIGYHPTVEEKFEHYPGFVTVENGGFNFDKFEDELEYAVFNEAGHRCARFSVFGEYICIPKEKIAR
tara:strand:- start:7594 stop:8319 length:726 start_codon:yes stop_codon:yes gene_type:complete